MSPDILKADVDKFVLLMIRILSDPKLEAQYITNPVGVLDINGISKDVKEVVLSGDNARIHAMFVAAGFSEEGKQIIHAWP